MPKKLCGAKTRSGGRCQRSPSAGRTRCRLHGGASPLGVASPHFRHGRYSKAMPRGLGKKFEEAGRDPFLLSHVPELKLLDVKLSELVTELGQAAGPQSTTELQKTWKEFQVANVAEDEARVATCVSTIDEILQGAISTADLWEQILGYIEARRKLLDSESKRLKDQHQTMGPDQLLAIIKFIVDVIRQALRKYVDDNTGRKILAAITNDLERVVSREVRPQKLPPHILN